VLGLQLLQRYCGVLGVVRTVFNSSNIKSVDCVCGVWPITNVVQVPRGYGKLIVSYGISLFISLATHLKIYTFSTVRHRK